MSLFFEERIKERCEDPLNDQIVFTRPWIINITPQNHEINIVAEMLTSYQYEAKIWNLELSRTGIKIFGNTFINSAEYRAWNRSSCFISLNLYYDNDMSFMLHSSSRIKLTNTPNTDNFVTPDGFMKKSLEAACERKASKMVIFIELHLPQKWFYRPFENPAHPLGRKLCDKYPKDMENHYKFVCFKMNDYSIICPDGAVPGLKIVLDFRSKFMNGYLKKINGDELVVDFSIDVVKPVIYYIHSQCFEMPKSFDFEYVHRLFKAIYFFEPEERSDLVLAIHESLCRKFVEEPITTFDSILRWLQISCQYSFNALKDMIITIIAQKYYFKWHQVFPENARDIENPVYRDVFDIDDDDDDDDVEMRLYVFVKVEEIMIASFQTNIILP